MVQFIRDSATHVSNLILLRMTCTSGSAMSRGSRQSGDGAAAQKTKMHNVVKGLGQCSSSL